LTALLQLRVGQPVSGGTPGEDQPLTNKSLDPLKVQAAQIVHGIMSNLDFTPEFEL